MIAREIVSNHFKPLQYSNTGEMALLAMHELNVNQMPVVDNGEYIGIISMEEITLLKHLNDPLHKIHISLKKPYVYESSHLFEVMKAALEYNTRIVPVLSDEQNTYVGVISAESCLKAFSSLNSIVDEGGIIELTVPLKDYSLTEIIRIIESNEVQPLACYTNIDQLNAKVNVTIKTNSNELSTVIAAFERYNYEINGFYHEDGYREDMKDRYDALMRFINI